MYTAPEELVVDDVVKGAPSVSEHFPTDMLILVAILVALTFPRHAQAPFGFPFEVLKWNTFLPTSVVKKEQRL